MTTITSTWRCPDWPVRSALSCLFLLLHGVLFHELLASFLFRWSTEPQYSHGFVIPLMAVGLGWSRRGKVRSGTARSSAVGVGLLVVGVLLHLAAAYFYMEFADCLALLCCFAGSLMAIWGCRLFAGIWPAVLFLAFMFPLPFSAEQLLSAPLQLMGAREAAYYIQACGIPAVAKGSTIWIGDVQLGVAEACSGMRMLTVFVAVSAATMIISRRARWEKVIILFSAIPIALICNIARIVATALAYHWFSSETADIVFHDLSGLLMMPAGMLLLFLELKLLDWLLVESADSSAFLRRPGRHHSVASVSG